MTKAIQCVLDESIICRRIIDFLQANRNAMDSAKGVAIWWLRCDERVAQAALDQLVECGLLAVRTLSSGMVYGLTRNPEIRLWLQESRPANGPTRFATAGVSATLILADLPEDISEEEPIGVIPIGEVWNGTLEKQYR